MLAGWVEYFDILLNNANPTDPSAIHRLKEFPEANEMDAEITESKDTEFINSLKPGEAVGPDGLPLDHFICGGPAIVKLLTEFCRRCWQERDVT